MGKTWTAIDSLSTIYKPDLFDDIKQKFFHTVPVYIQLCSYNTTTKETREESA